MGKIHVLDTQVSNLIAAGEVVERPAAAVKEMLENAVDAGAENITVEIKQGGVAYIRVTDDGAGMEKDDAQTAFLRHATSKISGAADLESISTLGFRGEALASIAAVAKVTLLTKTAASLEGTQVQMEGGRLVSCRETGCPAGTTIVVRELFYNTPARMKFLKKNYTEAGYVTDCVQKAALANPGVSFKLIIDGREAFFTSGDGSLQNACYAIFGREFTQSVLSVDYEKNGIKLWGLCGKTNYVRPNKSGQIFFVNGRSVVNKTLSFALSESYKNAVMVGKFPVAVLHVELDPRLVDANVHPAKIEVKFQREHDVYDCLYWGVKNALHVAPTVPQINLEQKAAPLEKPFQFEKPVAEYLAPKEAAPLEKSRPLQQEILFSPRETALKTTEAPIRESETKDIAQDVALETAESAAPYFAVSKPTAQKPLMELKKEKAGGRAWQEKAPAAEAPDFIDKPEDGQLKTASPAICGDDFKIVGQMFSTYVIVESGNEMLLIDQHAAHERIKYEQLVRDKENGAISAQVLLEPAVVSVMAPEFSLYLENKSFFEELGFAAEPFGDNTILVRQAPCGVEYGDIGALVLELLDLLKHNAKSRLTERQQHALHTIACKAAVKANHKMPTSELYELVRKVIALDGINTCPHGRPICVKMSKNQIEKEFKRIV